MLEAEDATFWIESITLLSSSLLLSIFGLLKRMFVILVLLSVMSITGSSVAVVVIGGSASAAVVALLILLLVNERGDGDGDGDVKPVTSCVFTNNLNTTAVTTRRNRLVISFDFFSVIGKPDYCILSACDIYRYIQICIFTERRHIMRPLKSQSD